jgi:hypothetical protein
MKEDNICEVTGRELPPDLAGYQCIVDGSIRMDDILVDKDTRDKQYAICDREPHEEVAGFINAGYDVYRKIPCPKAGALDPAWKEWKERFPMDMECDMAIKIACEKSREEAKTDDEGKPPLAMLPWDALNEVAMVQLYGEKKYKDFHNYRKGMRVCKNLSCALRHITKWIMGQDNDPESGLSHLAHAACRLLFLLQNIHDKTAIDNRYKPNDTK